MSQAVVPNTEVLSGEFVNLRPLRPEDAALTLGWRNAQRARFLNPGAAGGYDQRDQGNLKDLVPALGAGSVFVYEIAASSPPAWLLPLLTRLRRGVGSRVDSGCGRFTLFEQRSEE